MNVLSIQSHVAYGHVGNASAVFPMQRLGVEVWPVHTVQFSNHTGYGAWRGEVFAADSVREVVKGVAERGALARCDAVLSGYMGSAAIGEAILEAVAAVRAENRDALYCCDPVIGDTEEGVYVRPGITEFMRERAVPAADILTPNLFELNLLTGLPTRTLAEAKGAIAALQARGPRVVLVTSAAIAETPEGHIDLLAGEGGRLFRGAHPAPRARDQRRGRLHRRPVPRPLRPHPLGRRRAGAGGGLRLRPAAAHRRGGLAGDPDRRGTGRVRRPLRGLPREAV